MLDFDNVQNEAVMETFAKVVMFMIVAAVGITGTHIRNRFMNLFVIHVKRL